MNEQKSNGKAFSQEEADLVRQLREHPELMERFKTILEIARNAEGPLKTADQVEELLVEEMRRLGSATLKNWATQAEERVSEELRSQDPTVRSRKKKR